MKARMLSAVLLALIVQSVDGGQSTDRDSEQRRNFNPVTLMRPLRPIVNAPSINADKVTNQVSENELVVGVVINGKARAYPLNQLTGPTREIINDRVGGESIAATW